MATDRLVYNEEAIIEVTKEFTFDSAHYLRNYVGKCANLHGHTYKLHVTVRGKCNEIGMVIDFSKLKEVVKESLEVLDHAVLNAEFFFNPTAENMCVWFYERFSTEPRLTQSGAVISSIKLWETPTSFAEYRGERL